MKTIYIVTLACVIIILTLTVAQVAVVQANPFTPRLIVHPSRPFQDPYAQNFTLSFEYNIEKSLSSIDSFSFILDYKSRVYLKSKTSDINMTVYTPHPPLLVVDGTRYLVSETFENLANGNHSLKVYAHFSNGTIKTIYDTVITVDTNYMDPLMPIILSPLNQTTYNTKQVPLIYTTNKEILWSYYSVGTINSSDLSYFEGNITLPNLTEGRHELTLVVVYNISTTNPTQKWYTTQKMQTVIFSVDTTGPVITNVSVDNINTSDLLLNFTVDGNTSWVGYSLDNQANITINGDAVLRDLSCGIHNVTVYANDTVGNTGTSETFSFTVDEPFIETLATHSLPITVAIVSTVAVSGGLLVYLKRSKLTNKQKV